MKILLSIVPWLKKPDADISFNDIDRALAKVIKNNLIYAAIAFVSAGVLAIIGRSLEIFLLGIVIAAIYAVRYVKYRQMALLGMITVLEGEYCIKNPTSRRFQTMSSVKFIDRGIPAYIKQDNQVIIKFGVNKSFKAENGDIVRIYLPDKNILKENDNTYQAYGILAKEIVRTHV